MSGTPTKLVKIDDTEFELSQLDGVSGLDLVDRLTAALGPVVASAIRSGLSAKGGDAEAALGFLVVEAMATLPADLKADLRIRFAGLSKVKAGTLMMSLGDGLKLEPNGVFAQHFAGRFGHMTRWLLACLKWSFSDFLPSSPGSDVAPAAAAKP